MKLYLEWDEVKAGDWLECPAGEFEVYEATPGIVQFKASVNWGISRLLLHDLGIKPFRKEPLKVEFEMMAVYDPATDCYRLSARHLKPAHWNNRFVRVTVEEVPE